MQSHSLFGELKARHLGALSAVAVLMAAAAPAHAVVVVSTTPVVVPNTFDGIYLNLVTGASGTSGSSVSGYDINPYNSGTAISFYFGGSTTANAGVQDSAATAYLDLAPGSIVGPSSTFGQQTASTFTSAFQTVGTHVLGVKFTNEQTGALNYGYITFQTTGAGGFPTTITGWAYENTGAAITTVPEPGTMALWLAGLASVGGLALRRRQQ